MNIDELIEDAETRFEAKVSRGEVKSARRADELIGDVVVDTMTENNVPDEDEDTKEALYTALCTLSGRWFPGDWEDYEVEETEVCDHD